jgi:hypothetical protein
VSRTRDTFFTVKTGIVLLSRIRDTFFTVKTGIVLLSRVRDTEYLENFTENTTSHLRDRGPHCNFNERAGARAYSGHATAADAVLGIEFGASSEASVAHKIHFE